MPSNVRTAFSGSRSTVNPVAIQSPMIEGGVESGCV